MSKVICFETARQARQPAKSRKQLETWKLRYIGWLNAGIGSIEEAMDNMAVMAKTVGYPDLFADWETSEGRTYWLEAKDLGDRDFADVSAEIEKRVGMQS